MNKEYEWLLDFYLKLVSFDVVTGTFSLLQTEDRSELIELISGLKHKLEIVLPKIQDIQ